MCLAKRLFLLLACLLVSSASHLRAAENDDIQNIAERFVRQVVERDTDAILHSYSMTNEFRAVVPNADAVRALARNFSQLFGRLGDVVDSEIVEHPDLGLRSVFLYYQGTERRAKIWVNFHGTDIAGIHREVWREGFAEREPSLFKRLAEHPATWWIGSILGIIAIIFLFCYGAYRHNYDWGQSLDP
jgi:hypothetical protein